MRTVKQCPPFVDAMSHGFVIPLPCDVHVADGRLSWDWDLPPLSVEAHPRSPRVVLHAPARSPARRSTQSRTIVKFNCFWTVELEAGYSLFATHPVNRDDLPFRLSTGLVDADRFTDVGILFPALSGSTRPSRARCRAALRSRSVSRCPRPRSTSFASLSSEANRDAYAATAGTLLSAPGVYRKDFRAKRPRSAGEAAAELPEIEP